MADLGDLSPAELHRCRELAAPSWEATRRSLLTRLKDLGDSQGWQRFSDTYSGVNRAQIYMAKMRVGRLLKQEHTAMIQAESGGQATP